MSPYPCQRVMQATWLPGTSHAAAGPVRRGGSIPGDRPAQMRRPSSQRPAGYRCGTASPPDPGDAAIPPAVAGGQPRAAMSVLAARPSPLSRRALDKTDEQGVTDFIIIVSCPSCDQTCYGNHSADEL